MSIDVLERAIRCDVKAALGCTEPVTVALAAYHAANELGEPIERLEVTLSTNLFKNAVEVGIPGTGGRSGISLAAALGALAQPAAADLTVLTGIDPAWLAAADDLVAAGAIQLQLDHHRKGLFVSATATGSAHEATAIISGTHENLVFLSRDGVTLLSKADGPSRTANEVLDARQALADIPFEHWYRELDRLSEETRRFLLQGIEQNREVAKAGLGPQGKLGIGQAYRSLMDTGWLGNDVANLAKLHTSAAVDARMSGCSLPVMTSGGSGNQGLTITLPLHVLATHQNATEQRLAEALAISHGITSILKHHTGTLSAMCGCVVCSGIGLTAGVVHLLGGSAATIFAAVNNMVGSVTGIICDGAKVGCAIKLVCAVDSAFQSAFMALEGVVLPPSNGVLGNTVEESLRNIGLVAAPGMVETDDQILAIMIGKPGG